MSRGVRHGYLRISSGRVEPAYSRAVRTGARYDLVRKIMNRQSEAFSRDRRLRKSIADRLGWVDVASSMGRRVSLIERFGKEVLTDGVRHVVLMGMGGSSLCPEVFGRIYGGHPRLKSYRVLDSTDPAAISGVLRKVELKKTLFIVASKSGSTVETRSHEAFLIGELQKLGVGDVGRHFAAITDAGSDLEKSARRHRYRRVFINPSDIGGRFAALSYFGLVPGFFAGVDLRKLLNDACEMQQILREREGETNPALLLGSLLSTSAKAGIDKMTVVASKKTAPFVPWVEQLVAESTGKKKRGVVPVDAVPGGEVIAYAGDRMFVAFRMADERSRIDRLIQQGQSKDRAPAAEIVFADESELGGQFLLWEAAVAVAGRQLGVNPFDEPNVTESKENTKTILNAYLLTGSFPTMKPMAKWGNLSLLAAAGPNRSSGREMADLARLLKLFFTGACPPQYVSLLGYFKATQGTEAAFKAIRRQISDKTGLTTLHGYGPRYLHSTGQLYKGGPSNGLFIVFVRAKYGRLDIPGRFYDFGQLIMAQAVGDAQALAQRELPTLVIAIDGNPTAALKSFAQATGKALMSRKGMN